MLSFSLNVSHIWPSLPYEDILSVAKIVPFVNYTDQVSNLSALAFKTECFYTADIQTAGVDIPS